MKLSLLLLGGMLTVVPVRASSLNLVIDFEKDKVGSLPAELDMHPPQNTLGDSGILPSSIEKLPEGALGGLIVADQDLINGKGLRIFDHSGDREVCRARSLLPRSASLLLMRFRFSAPSYGGEWSGGLRFTFGTKDTSPAAMLSPSTYGSVLFANLGNAKTRVMVGGKDGVPVVINEAKFNSGKNLVEVVVNCTAKSLSYDLVGLPSDIDAGAYHIWINGTRVELPEGVGMIREGMLEAASSRGIEAFAFGSGNKPETYFDWLIDDISAVDLAR